ncbi:hypothetical protein Tco_0355940 [Tanacetum coccineum]
MSSKEETKGGSFKAPTGSKIGHSKKIKNSSLAMDSNPSQPLIYTLVDTGMHKEDQQATGGPTSLGFTSKARANPQLSSVSTAEADLEISAPSDFIPQQQGMNEGTKNNSYDHLFAGTDPHVLAKKTKFVSDGLETVLNKPETGTSIAAKKNSPEDDPIIVVDNSEEDEEEDKNEEIHSTTNDETEDILASTPPSPRSIQLQEHKNQLNELLVKSLTAEFSKILSAHDFSSSLPTELKDLSSKFNELTEEEKGLKQQVHELELELPRYLKDIHSTLEDFTKTVTGLTSQVAELRLFSGNFQQNFFHYQYMLHQFKLS